MRDLEKDLLEANALAARLGELLMAREDCSDRRCRNSYPKTEQGKQKCAYCTDKDAALSDPSPANWLKAHDAGVRSAIVADIMKTREHYEMELADAKAKKDKRLYELVEVAYLASLRPNLDAIYCETARSQEAHDGTK